MNTPLPPNYSSPTAPQTLQADTLNMDESMLSRNNVGDYFKGLILRYRIEQVIKQNDEQAVVTGVTIADLQTDQTLVTHNTDTEHFAASINKLPVSLLLLQDLRAHKLDL